MPPDVPRVSGRKAIRALEMPGFDVVLQRGSHVVMHRGSSCCVVPNHREIKTGTLYGLLEQAGIPRAQFVSALGKI